MIQRRINPWSAESRRWLAWLSAMAFCVGCGGPWRPGELASSPQTKPDRPTLTQCLQADRLGRSLFGRRDIDADESKTDLYWRIKDAGHFREGLLADRNVGDLTRYLQDEDTLSGDRKRPQLSFGKKITIYFQLTESMDAVPADLMPGQSVEDTTELEYYDWRGRLSGTGTLTRIAGFDGYESIEVPAGRFDDCVRLHVALEMHFPWLMKGQLETYAWFSPDVGEVRRVQRMSGWFLVFWFGSGQEYRLLEHRPTETLAAETDLCPSPCWKRGLVVFDRGYPRLRIGGMQVDY